MSKSETRQQVRGGDDLRHETGRSGQPGVAVRRIARRLDHQPSAGSRDDLDLFEAPSTHDPQSRGDPHIRGEVDNKYRSESELETRDSMKFRIACRVVDVRPNGNLVLEGRRSIRNNNEMWDYFLLGEIRPGDVLPNNTVLSENVAELSIHKREAGHVRDGYRRGWLLRALDKYQPF